MNKLDNGLRAKQDGMKFVIIFCFNKNTFLIKFVQNTNFFGLKLIKID